MPGTENPIENTPGKEVEKDVEMEHEPVKEGKLADGRDVEIKDGKVLVDGKEVEAGDKHNDIHEVPIFFDQSAMEVEVEETLEECFVNDARYGEYEDLKVTLSTEEGRALINSKLPDHGHTALMMAASNNHVEIVELLLTIEGLDVNAQNGAGNTALHWAGLMGRKRVVEMLLLEGAEDGGIAVKSTGRKPANCDMMNAAGQKAFDMAQSKGYSGVCEVIAKHTDFTYCSPEPDAESEKHRVGNAKE